MCTSTQRHGNSDTYTKRGHKHPHAAARRQTCTHTIAHAQNTRPPRPYTHAFCIIHHGMKHCSSGALNSSTPQCCAGGAPRATAAGSSRRDNGSRAAGIRAFVTAKMRGNGRRRRETSRKALCGGGITCACRRPRLSHAYRWQDNLVAAFQIGPACMHTHECVHTHTRARASAIATPQRRPTAGPPHTTTRYGMHLELPSECPCPRPKR